MYEGMTSLPPEDLRGDCRSVIDDFGSISGVNMDTIEIQNLDDFPSITESIRSRTPISPRSTRSGGSSSDVLSLSTPKLQQHEHRSKSARAATPKTPVSRPLPVLSNIPVPLKSSGPIKIPSMLKNAKSISRTSSLSASRTSTMIADKHTLEIQFLNKNKRYLQMKKELLEKQKPVVDLYQNLIQIKKRLEELGKTVKLEDLKLVPLDEYKRPVNSGGGEQVSIEAINGMEKSIEEIPKTLMDVCKNLLSRRAVIVDLLESVTRSEVDLSEVSDRIESLKTEGQQLQYSLDGIIAEHQSKIQDLISNWQKLLNTQCYKDDDRVTALQEKLQEQEKLTQESKFMIHDLNKQLADGKGVHEKSVAHLNGIIQTLRAQIGDLEQTLESERKAAMDFRGRYSTNAHNVKAMRSKIAELENDKKNSETINSDLHRKVKLLQDQIKHKDLLWCKEKEDLNKHIKQQEGALQKLAVDKTQFESTMQSIQDVKATTEEELRNTIASLDDQLAVIKSELDTVTFQRNDALEKCAEFEGYIARMGLECKETMNKVSCSMDWGKHVEDKDNTKPEAEHYMEDIVKDLQIRELEDKIRKLEKERLLQFEEKKQLEENLHEPTETERQLTKQQECITKYQILLEESEHKLREKSAEVANLRSEIRQLKVRQEALEEQNFNCPTDELQKMVEEGRNKLNELMKKSIESEQKLEHYANVIEKQTQQMSEMENLLRYRENMAGVLKASRDELVLEKESLTKYSQEMRAVLAEVTKEGKMKDRLIKELQEKIDMRERQISKLEKEVRELEANLMVTNEKRFKLQETIGTMEKELQSTKAHVNQLADINSRNMKPKLVKPF